MTQSPVTVSVVVGDDPWDFALGYALRRSTSLAWWLPTGVLADPWTVPWLLHRIEEIGQLAEHGAVVSLSDQAAAEALAEELGTAASESRDWSVGEDALELLRERPARLFSRAPGLETFPLQDGATGFLPPVLPEVGEAPGQRIYWMSELSGDNWQPLPDARLASGVVRWPSYDSASARPTRAGAAYLCPHFIACRTTWPRRSCVLVLRCSVCASSLRRSSPRAGGGSSRRTRSVRGGCSEAPRWRRRAARCTLDIDLVGALTALRSETAPDEERRGWTLPDRRTYYAHAELEAIRAESGLGPGVPELLERRILMRGLVFRCPICCLKAGTERTNSLSGCAAPGAASRLRSRIAGGSRRPNRSGAIA